MIDLIDVSKSYGPGLPAVNHANLHVDKGEFVFIVGNSGSGKSTLIKLLLKGLDSTSGTIIVSGEKLEGMKHRRVAKYRRKLGVVFLSLIHIYTGVKTLPDFMKDATDRNRTSPFAFTGNKFEFRMVGSKDSISACNVVLNTITAEAVSYTHLDVYKRQV